MRDVEPVLIGHFRILMDAASLKVDPGEAAEREDPAFRILMDAASLKVGPRVRHAGGEPPFRIPMDAASLKRGACLQCHRR